ncbi:MAG: class I SAM-dependent methyltransferase [Bdellovibrionaceae bacterium]|nr:class I SAM-dependent methyltransferase [Pseudobdellovibrionaceae bacterium]
MNFLRLHDDLLSVLFEDDDIIAIDKPYGFDAHTNDSKHAHGEAIKDGLIEIYEKNRNQKLHIIHRLDKTTTGVMIFGKSLAAAKVYKDFFLNRQVDKEYWFITQKEHSKKNLLVEQPIVHKAKELDAKTEMNWVRTQDGFQVWRAHPFSGRNHQIRIHAQVAGLSLLGDEKYEGAPYPFLCLHNHQMLFPNGIKIQSRLPGYFEDLKLLKNRPLVQVIFEVDRRQRLFPVDSGRPPCVRLVNHVMGDRGGGPGYNLDQMGPRWILYWLKEEWTAVDEQLWADVGQYFRRDILVHHASGKKIIGTNSAIVELAKPPMTLDGPEKTMHPCTWLVSEGRIQSELRGDVNGSCGLYLNQRLQRQWLLRNASQKSVLNVFSYTGGYAVAAAMGGAFKLTSVDSNKNNLAWSKQNFAINELDMGPETVFLCRDSITFMEGAVAKRQQFDIVVCDVPTFFRREKGVFRIEKDFEKLLLLCLRVLADEGTLLLSTAYDGFYIDDLRRKIMNAEKGLELSLILPSLDFEWPEQKANLKSFLIRRNHHA